MSRVHDALRKAGGAPSTSIRTSSGVAGVLAQPATPAAIPDLLKNVQEIEFTPAKDALLIDPDKPYEAPTEEFRTLRTRLNHMQSMQPIHTTVVTSASPTEGKSFSAINLALAQGQLSGNLTLLADFDLRRPVLHKLFQIPRTPGMTDYLQGKAKLEEIIRHVKDSSLYIIPAGEAVINPLELLNLKEVKQLLDDLPTIFNWVILDSPPLLFAADANLLSTLCHGTILVVRIGSTTVDSITRAMQSLSLNNLMGIIVNGARRGELYSKYSYYNTYYDNPEAEGKAGAQPAHEAPSE